MNDLQSKVDNMDPIAKHLTPDLPWPKKTDFDEPPHACLFTAIRPRDPFWCRRIQNAKCTEPQSHRGVCIAVAVFFLGGFRL